jgi:hypothetical protein
MSGKLAFLQLRKGRVKELEILAGDQVKIWQFNQVAHIVICFGALGIFGGLSVFAGPARNLSLK